MAEKNQKEEIDELEEDDFGDFEQAEGGESISKVEVINGISNQGFLLHLFYSYFFLKKEQYINQANPSEKKENFNEAQLINLALTKNTTIESTLLNFKMNIIFSDNIVVQEKVIENFEENIGRNFLNLEENILSSNSEKLDSENLEEQKNLHIQDKEGKLIISRL